ncbi:MAG: beta-N-acetylhexosaminidase [Oscillospiraceae bacterium]|nr:beta-N-acetylhexosaminidase [Oscillospiraceae bacterium]
MKLSFTGDLNELSEGLKILQTDYNFTLSDSADAIQITAVQLLEPAVFVARKNKACTIKYGSRIEFFRGLGIFLEQSKKNNNFEITETPQFTMNGAMFDVSQGNSVINVKSVKNILRKMSVMGLNMLMLYTEDSYVVPEHPYFGYMRGKYTYDDYKELDDYAYNLGIEMIPCIQILAHLPDASRWPEFRGMFDDETTLLVGNDRVYEFIDHMIKAASAPFRTKRIHVGMDEAWRLGQGNYLLQNGYKTPYDIMNQHMEMIMPIIEKYGLEPMMWSDMFFRAVANGGYYELNAAFTQTILDNMPKNMQYIYWDYYHDKEDFYTQFIDKHREFGSDPIFAGGIWTWTGPAINWGRTFNSTNPALTSCKQKGIKEVFVTIWGDNGTESNVYLNLLGLQLFAEHGYSEVSDTDKLRERFEFCTGAKYDDFVAVKYLDEVPGVPENNPSNANPSKYLVWQDILAGMFDYHIKDLPLEKHYARLKETFKQAKNRNGEFNMIFEYAQALCEVLEIKSELGLKITQSYKDGDKVSLEGYAKETLPEVYKRMENLRAVHKTNWYAINKAFGWEVLDMRYGSTLIRIRSAIEQITDYLNGKLDKIEELEEKRLSFNGAQGMVTYANTYGYMVSGSRIAPNA